MLPEGNVGWLSRIAEFLSPLLNGTVIIAYVILLTALYYEHSKDHGKDKLALFLFTIIGVPFCLISTAIISFVIWAVFRDFVTLSPLAYAISFVGFILILSKGKDDYDLTDIMVNSMAYYMIIFTWVILSQYLSGPYDDPSVTNVRAVSLGIMSWVMLDFVHVYMRRNWGIPRLGLPIAFIALLATAFGVGYVGRMDKHLAAVIGLVLAAVATVLAFTFAKATPLQRQIILTLAALAGGAIATEIPGFLSVDLSLGQKTGIAAGGALAVFIILYFWSAKTPRD
jgi:hypothetical protein